MLKYEKIIGMLSTQQKTRLLCDISALSSAEYASLGVPNVSILDLEKAHTGYPSPAEMANSWDAPLIRETAENIMAEENGANLFLAPSAKAALTPYGKGLSEDGRLSSAIAGEYFAAAEKYGLYTVGKGFYFSKKDAEWLDEQPNGRFIFEQVINPYINAAQSGDFSALSVAQNITTKNYEKANTALIKMVLRYKKMEKTVFICEKAGVEGTVQCILDGVICLRADFGALSRALDKYYQMRKSADRGDLSDGEIERAIAEYRAISPELIDIATDNVIDFAFKASKNRKNISSAEKNGSFDTMLRAVRESVVLLKNANKILPLSTGKRVCIIGDTAFTESAENFTENFAGILSKEGYKITSAQRGYELRKERSDKLLVSAVEAACNADTAIVFLGRGKARENDIENSARLSLPANQVALLDELGKAKCKVIAVLSGEYPADIVLPEKADAIIYAPTSSEYSAEALADILTGKYSPCGRLARTFYTDTDRIFKKQGVYKKFGMKSGPFIGYKYYDTADFYPQYVFGHGLSYVKFAYSSVSVNVSPTGPSVTFTIKNCGKMRAAEIAQIYMGMQNSNVIRAKKELCAFEKIELDAGETRTVTIPFSLPEIFDMENGQFAEEMGTYNIYIGSSVRDIRLKCILYAGDTKIKPDCEKAERYLLSESNIIADNYKLEADCKIMKKSVLNIAAGIAAIFLAILLKVYCLSTNTNALFFDIMALILAASGWVFFIAEFISRRKANEANKKIIAEANGESFENAETIELSAAEQLFAKEFDVTYSEEEFAVAENHTDIAENDNMILVNGEIALPSVIEDFCKAAKEKGVDFSENDAGKLFASMASSRVLLLHGMSEKSFNEFMQVLAYYFETSAHKDNVRGAYSSPEDILFASGADGSRAKTNAMFGIEEAQSAVDKIHFVGFDDVAPKEMTSWFAPIAKHAKNPYAHHYFKAHNEQNEETAYYFPQNIWFVINLAESATCAEIPVSISETATVNSFAFSPCEQLTPSSHAGLTYYQMEYLCDKLVSAMNISENVWRRFDRLETYVNSHVPFVFGNKLWLCAERYIAFSTACGKETEKSIDECLAAKLLPVIIIALNGKMSQGATSLSETLENAFGEENVTACRKVIKSCGADIA